jgi:hypothetical protein
MAADSSINETEAGTAAADEKPPSLREQPAGPPRPPRPAKRASGPVRIPMPTSGGLSSAARAAPAPRGPSTPVPFASKSPSSVPPNSAIPTAPPEPLAPASSSVAAALGVTFSKPVVLPDELETEDSTNFEIPLTRTKPPSSPALRFDSAGLNPSEQAPSAPFTPMRGVPALTHEPLPKDLSVPQAASLIEPSLVEPRLARPRSAEPSPPSEPPQATEPPPSRAPSLEYDSLSSHPPGLTSESSNSASSPPVAISAEDDREDTLVGEVAKDLLDLSSMEADENTRAYQAPQELIELARRQREERLLAKGKPAGGPAVSTASRAPAVSASRAPAVSASGAPAAHPSRAPAAHPSGAPARSFNSGPPAVDRTANTFRPKGAAAALSEDQDEPRAGTPPIDTIPTQGNADDAAPPVARSRPTRGVVSEEPSARPSAPRASASLSELARAASEHDAPDSMPAVSEVMGPEDEPVSALPPLSSDQAPWFTRNRRWLLLAVLFIGVGFVLARWRGLDLLLPR